MKRYDQGLAHEHSAGARITYGGDEFVFVEVSAEMQLAANFTVMGIVQELTARKVPGLVEVCPANSSLLLRIDPEIIHPFALADQIKAIEQELASHEQQVIETRIIEVPVWYDDPFTREVGAKFREGYHQDPAGTDLDYAARINGFASPAEFIAAHHQSPWLVSMVGFVAGLPFMYQLVDREHQLEVPKYLSPRTDTPKLTVGHGGCFGCIYSVRGAGGYQMFGVAAAPIYDPSQQLPDFADFMILFRPGDVVKFKPVSQTEYEEIQQQVAAGTFKYQIKPVSYTTAEAIADPAALGARLSGALS